MTGGEQKIVPHLWFAREVGEAADLYRSLSPHSEAVNIATLRSMPSGDTEVG